MAMHDEPAAPPAASEAHEALDRAGQLDMSVRRRSRWYGYWLLIFGAGMLGAMVTFGFGGLLSVVAAATMIGVLVAGLTTYQARQRVTPHGYGRRHGTIMASWGVLYAVALIIGLTWFQGELAWWLPVAVIVPLPFFVGAAVELRR